VEPVLDVPPSPKLVSTTCGSRLRMHRVRGADGLDDVRADRRADREELIGSRS
jgi:hypothetical protein